VAKAGLVVNRRTNSKAELALLDAQERLRRLEFFPPFGVILKDKTIGVTATTFTHNLGRKYNGYLIIRRNGAVSPVKEESNSKRDKEISLSTATTAVTADIWVF
jgi:hypothetical protein